MVLSDQFDKSLAGTLLEKAIRHANAINLSDGMGMYIQFIGK